MLVDSNGNPLKMGKKQMKVSQTEGLCAAGYTPSHPAVGMTMQRLARLFAAAEQGDLAAQSALYSDMLNRDGHIYAEMEKRQTALLTLDWHIQPPDNASAREKSATDALTGWLDGLDPERITLAGMQAIGYGFSAQEIQWRQEGTLWLPQALHLRPWHWFTTDRSGHELRLLDTSTAEGVPLAPLGWLVHMHNAKSGFIPTAGLFRVLAWPWLFKNYAIRDLAEFLEIYGLPARIAWYMPGTTDEDRDKLLENLLRLGHDAVAVLPQGSDLKFESAASGGSDPFMAMVTWAEQTQSKIILGGTLTAQADGKTSTNALGNIHNEVRHDLLISDARQIERMYRQLFAIMLTVNGYGDIPQRRLPALAFDTREVVDLPAFATAVSTLVNAGVETIPVSWVHKKSGIPLPDGDEPCVIRPAPAFTGLAQRVPWQPPRGLAALTQQPVMDIPQQALEQAADDVTGTDALSAAMNTIIRPIVSALALGDTPDEALAALAQSYPQLDDGELRQLLAQALFVGDIWGRLNGGH